MDLTSNFLFKSDIQMKIPAHHHSNITIIKLVFKASGFTGANKLRPKYREKSQRAKTIVESMNLA